MFVIIIVKFITVLNNTIVSKPFRRQMAFLKNVSCIKKHLDYIPLSPMMKGLKPENNPILVLLLPKLFKHQMGCVFP